MNDRYQSLIQSPVGQLLAKNLGLPNPVELERWTEGAALVDGTVARAGFDEEISRRAHEVAAGSSRPAGDDDLHPRVDPADPAAAGSAATLRR